jgi:hypothetical protein
MNELHALTIIEIFERALLFAQDVRAAGVPPYSTSLTAAADLHRLARELPADAILEARRTCHMFPAALIDALSLPSSAISTPPPLPDPPCYAP